MWGVRAVPLPIPVGMSPYVTTISALIATFWALYGVVNPMVVKGTKALAALKANDHQVDGPVPQELDEFGLSEEQY